MSPADIPTIEAMLAALAPLPLEPTEKDIVERRRRLNHIGECVTRLKARLNAEAEHLFRVCDHKNQYSSNLWGRDPGGGGCNTCGKSW